MAPAELAAFPDVVALLNRDIRWTTDLGNAFLTQQADVMNAIQSLRVRAQNNGRLATTPQQVVTDDVQNGQTAVRIEPANPQVVYPPVYDPAYVWGQPASGYYPAGFLPWRLWVWRILRVRFRIGHQYCGVVFRPCELGRLGQGARLVHPLTRAGQFVLQSFGFPRFRCWIRLRCRIRLRGWGWRAYVVGT